MRHNYRILHDMLVAGKIDVQEFKERQQKKRKVKHEYYSEFRQFKKR